MVRRVDIKAEDIAQGRIYRLSNKPKKYDLASIDPNYEEGAVKGILSGHMDIFYQSWQKIAFRWVRLQNHF